MVVQSLLLLIWVWPHSLAVTCFMITTLAAALEPKIQLSHPGIESPFGYKALTPTVVS